MRLRLSLPALLALAIVCALSGAVPIAATRLHKQAAEAVSVPAADVRVAPPVGSTVRSSRTPPRPPVAVTAEHLDARPASAVPGESPLAGKGMWIWQMGRIAGGDPNEIVRNAIGLGITHVYVRVGSGTKGLNTLAQVAPILPVAHRAGIKVIAWYFPYFNDIAGDVRRSRDAINSRYAGETFDGFAADIESAPGSALSAATGAAYSRALRAAVPHAYLIVVPPRPSPHALKTFPFDAIIPHYDAVAPMVYWGKYDPVQTTVDAIRFFAGRYGKPVAPIGQAYDMGPEGGPKGNPPPWQSWAFMRASKEKGAVGVSFWVWETATTPEFHSIREFPW